MTRPTGLGPLSSRLENNGTRQSRQGGAQIPSAGLDKLEHKTVWLNKANSWRGKNTWHDWDQAKV